MTDETQPDDTRKGWGAVAAALLVSTFFLVVTFVPFVQGDPPELVLFFGRFHPVILHLPIGFLLAWAFMEMAALVRPGLGLRPACGMLLWLTVLSAIPAAVAGSLLATSGGYDDTLLFRHRLFGSATVLACVWLLVLRSRTGIGKGEKRFSMLYHGLMVVNLGFLSLAGHLGGSLTHGSTYLTKYMPASLKFWAEAPANSDEVLQVAAGAAEPAAEIPAEVQVFHQEIAPLLEQTCFGCHGEDKQKGDMRLDMLDPDMMAGGDAEGWHAALDMINSGEMPPEGKKNFTPEQRKKVVDWMTGSVEKAIALRRGTHKSVIRRLTKTQYSYALQDLLGLPVDFGTVLPDDGLSHMGFSNAGETQIVSPLHIEYYQKIAREALGKAIGPVNKPPVTRYQLEFGKNISTNVYARASGYQSIDLPGVHYETRVLDEQGRELDDTENAPGGKKVEDIKKNIMVDFRGSADRSRWGMVEDGVVLYSPVPVKEQAPRSWQGPGPNLKMLIRNDFPTEGDFLFRVRAAKTGPLPYSPYFFTLDRRAQPLTRTVDGAFKPPPKSERFSAEQFTIDGNLRLENGVLISNDLGNPSEAHIAVSIPSEGIYQIELVRSRITDKKKEGKVRLLFDAYETRAAYKAKDDQKLKGGRVVSVLGVGNLEAGEYTLRLKSANFVDVHELILIPCPINHPVAKSHLQKMNGLVENEQKYGQQLPSLQAFLGTRSDDGMDYEVFDESKTFAPQGLEPREQVFRGRLENLPVPIKDPNTRNPLANILILGLYNDHLVTSGADFGPPVKIQHIEFEAPYYESWPPASYTNIFTASANKADKDTYTREVLTRFIRRAFRKDPEPERVDFFFNFWKSIEAEYKRYEDGVKEALVAVLCSPEFLFLAEPGQEENGYALANRLSFFLWNSPPDNALLELARQDRLSGQLDQQVERLLQDPRSDRFIHTFTREWLRLDRQENISINIDKYPGYNRFIKRDLPEETRQFVRHLLRNNMSIQNVVDSDFAMLNQNLAAFYGMPGVAGSAFRPVKLAPDSRRGGLLTQAAFLAGHSNGTEAHPIKRGVWLMSKILGDEPPPPPPNVPELDSDNPDFKGLTIRQQLELHRSKESCVDCHLKIDPWGVAFEQFDAIGRFQADADAKTELIDGTPLNGIEDLKTYLKTEKQEDLTRSITRHLLAYALGRDLSFMDDEVVDEIVSQAKMNNDGLKDLIKIIVAHPVFSRT